MKRILPLIQVANEKLRSQTCKWLGMMVQKLSLVMADDESNSNNNKKKNVAWETLWQQEHDNDMIDMRNECLTAARMALLPRLTDKSQAVRKAAIEASGSFFCSTTTTQNDEDNDDSKNDDLLNQLLWNLAHDPSAANRSAVLQHSVFVLYPTVVMDDVIGRIRDTKVKVRTDALEVLLSLTSVEWTPEQYAKVLQTGLSERYVQQMSGWNVGTLLFVTGH
jgi:hypothetical protein